MQAISGGTKLRPVSQNKVHDEDWLNSRENKSRIFERRKGKYTDCSANQGQKKRTR
jgi:hypothetical protein